MKVGLSNEIEYCVMSVPKMAHNVRVLGEEADKKCTIFPKPAKWLQIKNKH